MIMLSRGAEVSGSDREDSPRLARLRAAGARVAVGHDPANLGEVDLVVASSAIKPDNPELAAARERGIRVVKRDRWLPELARGHDLVACAGTHGKTTTTALLALVLTDAGLDPTVVVGGEVPQLGGSNVRVGQGRLLVLEADEYDGAFAGLTPRVATLTTVEFEHPDCFADEAAVQRAFAGFVRQVTPGGLLVACADDPGVAAVLRLAGSGCPPLATYGLGGDAAWQATGLRPNPLGGTDFEVTHQGEPQGTFRLRIPGTHNVRNALAVLAAAHRLGVPPREAAGTLARFTGAARRFQPVGEAGGVQVIDDYAHHPTEVRATLAAARQRLGDRPIWVVFQPHTYTRTERMLDQFATAFTAADRVYVTDIYAAREVNTSGIHARDLVARIAAPPAAYAPVDGLAERLARELPGEAAVLTLGAGDITAFGPRLLDALRQQRP